MIRAHHRALLAFVAALLPLVGGGLSTSCGGASTGRDATVDDGRPEVIDLDLSGDFATPDDGARDLPAADADAGADVAADAGPDSGADANALGEFGTPCRANSECVSGYCVDGHDGPVCSQSCVLECPADWVCRASLIGNDVISLCIPLGADLCKPCKVDTQCSDGSCIEIGDGTFCGRTCDEAACPTGYDCLDVPTTEGVRKQCIPRSQACDCLVTQAGAKRPCAKTSDAGTCLGFETCDPEQGWICDAPVPTAETCNGLDDNCNHLVDETFPERGAPCVVGEGECRRVGTYACKADETGVECSVEPGAYDPEACDYKDNDCDGLTDEDFRVDGEYRTDRACGNCYVDCTAIFTAAKHNAAGHCAADAMTGEPFCTYACLGGHVDADRNPENGCELLEDPDAIYVSTPENGGVDGTPCGTTWDHPCATVSTAISVAASLQKKRVLVSDGAYAGNLVLADGVSVLGGYSATTWQRDPAANLTILQGSTPDGAVSPHRKAVEAVEITAPTEFSGFTVYGENAYGQRPDGRGGNSYAIYARDCGPALVIRDNVVQAGRGAPGTDGANGDRGGNGADGTTGSKCVDSGVVGECSGVTSPGGTAGASTCGASGGRGADSVCAAGIVQMPSGAKGQGTAGGAGGAGGWSDTVSSACLVCHSDGQVDFGYDGGRGGSGAAGTGGNACSDDNGQISGGEWLATLAGNGVAGAAGSGGGGAGAGAGVDLDPACGFNDRVGSAGGGGGAGGCGGMAGEAGRGGGASIGIFVVKTVSAAGLAPTLAGNTVARNQGGAGGQGGSGGTGGVGGSGGEGGSVDCAQNSSGTPYWFKVCIGKGGTGGDGGQGGPGGGGGGGCGGPSWGILGAGVQGDAPAWCDVASGNTFSAFGGGGPGGAGGNSAGNPGNPGSPGAAADCRIQ